MILISTAFGDEYRAIERAIVAGRIADRPCEAIMTGIGLRAARRALRKRLDQSPAIELVISIGIAASLTADWKAFDRALIRAVTTSQSSTRSSSRSSSRSASLASDFPPDKMPSGRSDGNGDRSGDGGGAGEPPGLVSALYRLHPSFRASLPGVDLVSVTQPVLEAEDKRALGLASGAQMCDMETHALATECAARAVPWIGARIVSDTAQESLPPWLVALSKCIAGRRWKRAAGLIATHPQDLPSLIRLGLRMRRLQPALTQFTIDIVSHVLPA